MISRFFDCTVSGCIKPSLRTGGCDYCRRYLCATHSSADFHSCRFPDEDAWHAQQSAELSYLQDKMDDGAVCRLAQRLNGGKECKVEHALRFGPETLMGNANYHARIRFKGSSPSWLIRVPRVTTFNGCPLELVDYLVRSEFATLRFLEQTSVPAPRVFAYGVKGHDHGVGVSFILMEELLGKPWISQSATTDEKAKVWNHVAEIMVEIERYPFGKAGSLVLHEDNFQLSAVASDRFIVLDPQGPFINSTAYYTAFVNQQLDLIVDKQLYSEYSVDAFLIFRFLKDSIPQPMPEDEGDVPEQFFLKHVDDKGDHLLVDPDLNITGIIDWQMARVVPRREAFGPSLITVDMDELCRGQVSLSADDIFLANAMREKGLSEKSSSLASVDEKTRRFFWGLACEPNWSDALPLAQAILKVFGVHMLWTDWKANALIKYRVDTRLHKLLITQE